ncbi:MAG: hypothetical protein PHS86_15090, partial [Syntrophaceae bacterium]|nr:hypothetical protein [Syntrophaceae bacterium]
LTTIDNLLKKISEIKYEIDKTENDIPKKQKESEDARVTFVKCENQLSKLRELEKELEGHRLLIKDARSFVKTKDLLKGLVTKKSCADVIVKEIELSKSLRSQTVAPDKKTLKKIKELAANIDASRMKIDSAMMRIEIKPEKSFSLEVIEADQTGSCNLSENEIFTVQGTPAIVARIPGVATMKISGPSVSIEQDKKSLDVDQRKLDEILRPFTTNNIAELEALTERAEELDDKINDREKDLKRELGSYSLNDLDSEIITLRKDVHETIVKVPQWETVLPDPDQMEEEYGTQKKQLDQKRSELSSARDVAQKNALETKGNLEQARKDLNRRKDELETSQQELDKENEDGKTREQRIKERSEISIKCTATQKEFDDAVRKLKHFGEDPQLQIDILQPMVSESETQAERDKEELQRTEGKLEDAAGKVSYSEKISLEEKVYQCQERYDRELLRQNAIKLLMDTMTRCREKVFSGVSEPVEKRATEIIKRIGDVKFSVVGLKQDFEPKEIQPAMTSDPVTIQSISGGENEQLHLAVRIALAETLIKTDRHFMLLDDVLTATDSCRMDRILGILEELTERFQIIVLTCHPDRYQKLLSAHFIDLLSA